MRALIVGAWLALAVALGAGCPQMQAAGETLKACELGQLPAMLEGLIASVAGILMGGADQAWQGELEQLGARLAPGQLDCVVSAVGTGIKGTMRKGQGAPEYVEAARRADAWLARGKRAP